MTDVWVNFSQGIFEYSVESFSAVDPWFYPLLLFGIIGYIYTSMHSVTAAVVGIIITLGIFGVTTSVFEGVPELTQILYLITIIGISMLLFSLLIHRRRVM